MAGVSLCNIAIATCGSTIRITTCALKISLHLPCTEARSLVLPLMEDVAQFQVTIIKECRRCA